MKIWQKKQKIHIAAIILGSSVLLSRFMGLIRDKVISYWFGASIESDIYFTAFVIPDFINYLLAGAYFSITLIPLLSNLFHEDEEDGWRFFSCVCFWIGFAIVFITAILELLLPHIAHYIAPGFNKAATERLILFIRIILPAQVFFLIGACFNAVLYLRRQFIVPSIAPLIYNGFIITIGILFRKHGMVGFCWGVLLGAFLGNMILPILAVKKGDGLKLHKCLWHRKMKSFIFMSLPLMLGQSIVVLDEQLIRIFGSVVGTGTVSHLNYARRLMFVPIGVIAQAAGVASYPFLAELYAEEKLDSFYQLINRAVKNTLFVIIPVVVVIALSAKAVVGLIFQQGRFLPEDTINTAILLKIFLLAVPFWGYQQILGRGFYAMKDTLSPVIVGTVSTLLCLPMYFYGARLFGGSGIAGASVLGVAVYSIGLTLWWKSKTGNLEIYSGLFRTILCSTILCIPPGLSAIFGWKITQGLFVDFSILLRHFIECTFKTVVFTSVWIAFGIVFFRKEICEVFPGRIKNTIKR